MIYISAFAQATVLGQKLPFSLSGSFSRERREQCTMSSMTTRSPSMAARLRRVVGFFLRPGDTASDSSAGPCSTGVTPPPNGSSSPERRMVCRSRADTPTESSLPNWLNLVETHIAFPGLRYTQFRFEPVRWAIFFGN